MGDVEKLRQALMRALVATSMMLLAACKPNAEDRAERDQREIAAVKRANDAPPPLEAIVPQPVGAPDIERYDISGPSCAYAPGTSFGALVIAREADAFMKIDGKVQRFAADPGSRELPEKTRSVYNSKGFTLKLQVTEPATSGAERQGTVTLYDPQSRVVFDGAGLARCTG